MKSVQEFMHRFSSSAQAFRRQFEETRNIEDLSQAISQYENAVDSVPFGTNIFAIISQSLGYSYSRRFRFTGNIQDIEHAVSHHQKSVESTPADHSDLSSRLEDLADSYFQCYKCTGNLEKIDQAILYHQRALKSTPSGHADLPRLLKSLGNSYLCHFEHTGQSQDIVHAISHLQKAVESIPSGHSDVPGYLSDLGNAHLRRFEHNGNLQDIEDAIFQHQKAVELTPPDHSALPTWFNNLGNSYYHRCRHSGDVQDADLAISYHQKAADSTSSDHANLPRRFSNLGNSYICRFGCTGNLQDIKHAISHHQKAVESTPPGHRASASRLNSLGTAYLFCFKHSGTLQDIDNAISYHEKAVEATPLGHAHLPGWLHNLGNSYSSRFHHTGNIQDIEHAISNYQKSIEYTPSGHASIPDHFNDLGKSYETRFQSTRSLHDVQRSIASYRRSAQANGNPSVRLKAAKTLAVQSLVHDTPQCLADLALSISLLSEVAGLEQIIDRRHSNLRSHSGLVQSAVATALQYFDRSDFALEWLEQGRCLVWNQFNQLRAPVNDLCVRSPSLADHFMKVTNALESYGTRSSFILTSDSTLMENIQVQDQIRNHTTLAEEYKQLLKEIRALPDFHDFLKPPNASNLLSSLPPDGPVIIFNIDKTRCDALALIGGINKPLHIPLQNFSLAEAEELLEKLQTNVLKKRNMEDSGRAGRPRAFPSLPIMTYILKVLWNKVLYPVFEALGYSAESCPDILDRHRIWWCPTGPLAFLPLHAAGIYNLPHQAGQCVSDFVVSSYTPTVDFLNKKFEASHSISSKFPSLLLISQPNTPGLVSIPSTRKEIHDIKALIDGSDSPIDMLLLDGAEATTDNVKQEMGVHHWVHFACHGIQDMNDPLKSGVHLHDGRLELLEIMRQQISNPELAFLSACQTSKGDLKLSEEVVHLAAGMLAAGYRGVVSTMWSISDMHGPEFATEFYKYLLMEKGSEGLDSTQAAYALDYAVRKVREHLGDDDTAFLTWVPYVHFGY
ncbi:hypothetical protein M413DRAFT_20666 [Hebeloma cylindrosporum]|uniref:CHAT domain-containing protein n=1 Tax=Hebeloma cylindrosporum TaxID=76867 RepID=A0A0C3BV62_HEBCY|nr:hypothetical protein M413DRAFT_20666 [Hebeloma cylindrosporum h7]